MHIIGMLLEHLDGGVNNLFILGGEIVLEKTMKSLGYSYRIHLQLVCFNPQSNWKPRRKSRV